MARSMFPFDDSYRVTFTGSFLPSQNDDGEITPPTVPDPRYKAFPLDEAPQIPFWRTKNVSEATGSASTTPTSLSDDSPNVPEIGDKTFADKVTEKLQVTSIDGKTIPTTVHMNPQRTITENKNK